MPKRRSRKRPAGNPTRPGVRPLFVAGLVVYAFALQFCTTGLGSVDGYFHIRYSAMIAELGWRNFPPPFPWLPLTILSADRYFDHHMLFHLWLVPFATGNLILGAKLASAIGVYRMEMPRVQALSLLCLLLALALLIRRRFTWLIPLAWFYTWLYDAFPLLLAMCVCALAAELLTSRTFRLAPVGCASLGIAGGLLVNPYFPHNLRFITHHYLAKLTLDDTIPVGAEWYPLALANWVGWAGLAAILVGGVALLYHRRRHVDYENLTMVLVAVLFFILLWRSSRFVEYFVPFSAIALSSLLHVHIDHGLRRIGRPWHTRIAIAIVGWLLLSSGIAVTKLRSRPPPTRYAEAARWIASNTTPGSLVFTSDWDDFPLLYFHNTANHYVVGLDPTYLAERTPELYSQWQEIGNGQVPRPAATIHRAFESTIAFTDRQHLGFIDAMEHDPLATRAYEDQDCVVYTIANRR